MKTHAEGSGLSYFRIPRSGKRHDGKPTLDSRKVVIGLQPDGNISETKYDLLRKIGSGNRQFCVEITGSDRDGERIQFSFTPSLVDNFSPPEKPRNALEALNNTVQKGIKPLSEGDTLDKAEITIFPRTEIPIRKPKRKKTPEDPTNTESTAPAP